MTIFSREPISEEDRKKIDDILRESNCPHESLTKTFERYSGIIDDVITFDGLSPSDYIERRKTEPPE